MTNHTNRCGKTNFLKNKDIAKTEKTTVVPSEQKGQGVGSGGAQVSASKWGAVFLSFRVVHVCVYSVCWDTLYVWCIFGINVVCTHLTPDL